MKADVIIIGGGLLGTAAAYQLAKRGAGRILLFERHDIASQATSRAACLLTRARTKPAVMRMVQETYDCIAEIEALLGGSLEMQTVGSITISASEATEQGMEALQAAAEGFGIPVERIGRERVKELLPWIETASITGAIHMPTDAFIDSALLCNGYAKAARHCGVELRSRTAVREITHENGTVTGVVLADDSRVEAPVVIDAAGAWANLLSMPLGVGLPMTPVRSHFWITEQNPAVFPAQEPFAVLPDARAFTRPDVGGLIIGIREPVCVGFDPHEMKDSIEYVDFSPDNGWETLSQVAGLFEPFFPAIRDTGIAHYVAGPSCYVPDAMFVVGPSSRLKGFYAAAGCCGGGVACGGGIGRLVAEQVLGAEPFVDPAPFCPERFGEIDPFDPAFQKRCADARSNKKGG